MDADLRAQLIEARERIHAQLCEIEARILPGASHGGGGAPDFLSVTAELVGQLEEITKLLADDANGPSS